MSVNILCQKLSEIGCQLLSKIGPAPSDIDIYVPAEILPLALKYVEEKGFICNSTQHGQYDYRSFEGGDLYILDLLTTFDVYMNSITSMTLSRLGNKRIGASPSLHKSFKYLCCGNNKKTALIVGHKKIELELFLQDRSNFYWIHPRLMFAVHLPIEELVKVARSPWLGNSFIRDGLNVLLIEPWRRYSARVGKGFSIAFIGPDGSGKTFLINKFKFAGVTRLIYMGDWFFFFQGFYNFLMKIPSPFNRFVYLLYPIENYIRLIRVYFHRFLGRIILIDRYPGTNRNIMHEGFLGSLNRFMFDIFPKPDLIAFLYAPPNVIYERKQELSVQEISVIQSKLQSLLIGVPHIILNTEKLDESLNLLLKKSLNYADKT